MTFLEALYGSQYQEISQRGGDTSKGRLNGNLLLSVIIVLCVFIVFTLVFKLSQGFAATIQDKFNHIGLSGKFIGKISGLILLGLAYLLVVKSIGTVERYNEISATFMRFPPEERKKANAKILIPFFILLALFIILLFV